MREHTIVLPNRTGHNFPAQRWRTWDTNWPVGDKRFTLLPFAGADYAFLNQPSISEDKAKAARLKTDSQTYQSLRAVFGLKAETAEQDTASAGYTWRGNATLAYNRELLSHAGNIEARFIEMNGDFTTDVRFATRSSVSASAGVSLTSSKGTTLDFQLRPNSSRHGTSVRGLRTGQLARSSNNWHTFPFRRVKAKDMKKFFLKMVANLRLTYADTL